MELIHHWPIPELPFRPRVHPIDSQVIRSYTTGRESFSRACQNEVLTLIISTSNVFPEFIQARLVTTMNSADGIHWIKVPFDLVNERKLICIITPEQPGLYSFRTEFSLDKGITWVCDTVPDAWILVDPPQVDGLCVYTLIPTVSGTIADWKIDLKRIKAMGFNAIHLLPVTSLDTSQSPYAAKDLFSIDQSYLEKGLPQNELLQLEAFIEEARILNMKLCFDLVLNHIGVDSTMAQQAPDWIVPDQNQADGFKRANYWSNQGLCNWNDLILINYEHPSEAIRSEIWTYMIGYALFWAKYANLTGGFIRFDNLHSSDPEFIVALTDSLHAQYPGVGILAEYFTDERTLLRTGPKWGLNLNLATPWNYKFVPKLRDYLLFIHRISNHIRYFMPITSHDCAAPAQEFGTADSTIPRYVVAALLGTGATGIPQGVEYGESERIDFIGRKPKMKFSAEPKYAQFIARINTILTDHIEFRRGGNCTFVDDGHPAVIAAYRCNEKKQESGFLIVCNFDTSNEQHIDIQITEFVGNVGPLSGFELLNGLPVNFTHSIIHLMLPPCGAQVIRFVKQTIPVISIQVHN